MSMSVPYLYNFVGRLSALLYVLVLRSRMLTLQVEMLPRPFSRRHPYALSPDDRTTHYLDGEYMLSKLYNNMSL